MLKEIIFEAVSLDITQKPNQSQILCLYENQIFQFKGNYFQSCFH